MRLRTTLLLTMMLTASIRADIITWPGNDDWIPLQLQDESLENSSGVIGNKGHPYLDIVGDSTYASGYLQFHSVANHPDETEDHLLLRLRVNGAKARMKGAYQVFFDTDGDDGLEWVLQFTTDNLDQEGLLQFGTAGGETRDGITFGAIGWTGTYAGNVNWTGSPTGDGSQFGGDDDFFLDISMPWDEFSNLTGVQSKHTSFRVLMATAQQGGSFSEGEADASLMSLTSGFNDFGSLSIAVIPEPATAVLLAGSAAAYLLGRRIFQSN